MTRPSKGYYHIQAPLSKITSLTIQAATSCYNYANSCCGDHGFLDIPMLEPHREVLSTLPATLPSTSAVRSRLRNNAGYDLLLGEVAAVETEGESDYSYYSVSKYVSFCSSGRWSG